MVREVTVITDHKPLVNLFQKNVAATSPRLARMLVKLLDYQLKLVHQEGRKMLLSDALSRLSSHNKLSGETIPDLDVSIHDIEHCNDFTVLNLEKIREHVDADPAMQILKRAVTQGFPATSKQCEESIRSFFSFRDDLSIVNGLVLKNMAVVIPKDLQQKTLQILHQSHMGITKTQQRAKGNVFWPGITNEISAYLAGCHACAKFQDKQQKEPHSADVASTKPWTHLAMDNFEYQGQLYLLLVDRFTKFAVVRCCHRLTTAETTKQLLQIFFRTWPSSAYQS